MQATERLHVQPPVLAAGDLEHIAFTGQRALAHGLFRGLSPAEQSAVTSKYVFAEVVLGGIDKVRKFLGASAEEAAREEKAFVDRTLRLFVRTCGNASARPRELFETLLCWSGELTRMSLPAEALAGYDEVFDLGVDRYPDLRVRCMLEKANLLHLLGRGGEAQALFAFLANRPYLVPGRGLVPEILFGLAREALRRGEVEPYRTALFRGLRRFYTSIETRRLLFTQLVETYRRSYKVLLDRRVPPVDRALFLTHWAYFKAERSGLARAVRLPAALRLAVLGGAYGLSYSGGGTVATTGPVRPRPAPRRRNVLVTRAMGGIGDLLMMTPGLHALRKSRPSDEIHLAIPRRYFSVFEGNQDVTLLDIEDQALDPGAYRRWFDFTDCPAARVESRTAPRVRRSRIDIFASALGLSWLQLRRMDRRPRYFVSGKEREMQKAFWSAHRLDGKTVVGVQIRSDEVYRDYPRVEALVRAVSARDPVLLFDAEVIAGYEGENKVKVGGVPMRQAFALAAACSAIIAPDSAFVHLAGAFDIPCVSIYGPIDGKVRTRHYPRSVFLDSRSALGCIPCWRNDKIPCKLTNLRASSCLESVSVSEVQGALAGVLRSAVP